MNYLRPTTCPVICAIDTPDLAHAQHLCQQVQPYVGAIKIGLEFFIAQGAKGTATLATCNVPLFLDLKLHDIPNTVYHSILATAEIAPFMTTVHCSGGVSMLQASMEASMEVAAITGKERPLIIGVTVLTSLDNDDIHMINNVVHIEDQVKRLADIAQSSGLDGVVCSPQEIALLREHCGDDFLLVVPGIRTNNHSNGDQKRTMAPLQAIDEGADDIVVGRPITQAKDPAEAAKTLFKQ